MKETELIQIALMLTPPWQVAECQFDVNQKRLDIHLDFAKGSRFFVLLVARQTALSMTQNQNPGDI